MLRALLSCDSNINVWEVISYELASVPPSIFTNDGMRLCKKWNLLSGDCSRLKYPEDMKALLTSLSPISQLLCSLDNPFTQWWHSWRFGGEFQETYSFVPKGQWRVPQLLYLLWVQHQVSHMDAQKTGENKKHLLVWSTAFPPQKVVLSSVRNKMQLIHMPHDDLT